MLAAISCKKDKAELPPETQIGANTFGCLVNGKVWVPKGTDYYSGNNVTAYYQHIYPSPDGFVFRLSASDYEKNPLEFFSIILDSAKIQPGIPYLIKNGHLGEFSASYWIGSDQQKTYSVKEPLTGTIIFKKFDEVNLIASGTFWFDARNIEGSIIHVTEGRFDVKYTL